MEKRPLGTSGLAVSAMSLGSWRTYERIPREQALAVMQAARDAGITFLDDARYNDETGTAPLASGYSEVLFGELFRAAGWNRDETIVANKLWWEFWPDETAMQEIDGSLARTVFDHIDIEYSCPLPDGLEVADAVEQIAGLIEAGKARAWGMANWTAEQTAEAARVASALGVPGPAVAQLPYSLVSRSWLEDPAMTEALADAGARVVASASLAFGALSGKYRVAGTSGRIAAELDDPDWADPLAAGEQLVELGARLGAPPATLAFAFALAYPSVASVLFGATRPEQITENVAAVALLSRMDARDLAALRAVGAE
jgi:aryl-alcohol dehydrogenase-like predicted oxidoreductase